MVVNNFIIFASTYVVSWCLLQTFYTRCRLQHQMDLIEKEVSNLLQLIVNTFLLEKMILEN